MRKINIEKLSEKILLENNVLHLLPVPIIRLTDNYNINVYEKNLPRDVLGAIRWNQEKDRYEMLVDEKSSEACNQFVIARLLSVVILIPKMIDNANMYIYYRNEYNGKIDEQLDKFARALVINKTNLMELYKYGPSYSKLARTFGVTESLMTQRILEIENNEPSETIINDNTIIGRDEDVL